MPKAWWDRSPSEWGAVALTLLVAGGIWAVVTSLVVRLPTPLPPDPPSEVGFIEFWSFMVQTGANMGIPGLLFAASLLAPRSWRRAPAVGGGVALVHFLLGYLLLVAFARSVLVIPVGLLYMIVGGSWAWIVRRRLERG